MRTEAIAEAARTSRTGTAQASGGAWHATLTESGSVIIGHYATSMMEIQDDGSVIPISRGWGSVSDKQGINKILRYEGAGVLYADIFG
jgi:hypothetical protein